MGGGGFVWHGSGRLGRARQGSRCQMGKMRTFDTSAIGGLWLIQFGFCVYFQCLKYVVANFKFKFCLEYSM